MAGKHRHICPDALDDAAIAKLAKYLPTGADHEKFAKGVSYARDQFKEAVNRPDLNARFREVNALYKAACRSEYEIVAKRIEDLSPAVCELLTGLRAQRPIPSPEALRDPRRRDKACRRVKVLCTPGGGRRPTGNRSPTWEPLLAGPRLWIENKDKTYSVRQMQERPERQRAERVLLMWLRVAWWDATGKAPRTVNPHRPGKFARMVGDCLQLVSPSTNAVKLIQRFAEKRRAKRPSRSKKPRRSRPLVT